MGERASSKQILVQFQNDYFPFFLMWDTTNMHAELMAFMEGLKLAMSNNFTPLEVNTDSTEVINMINKGNLIYEPLIYECKT